MMKNCFFLVGVLFFVFSIALAIDLPLPIPPRPGAGPNEWESYREVIKEFRGIKANYENSKGKGFFKKREGNVDPLISQLAECRVKLRQAGINSN